MKLYLAGGLNFCEVVPLKKLGVKNVLSSWLEKKSRFYDDFNIFLDSGAFTAETSGKKINIKKYIKHIKKHKDKLDVYAGLDVIYDAEGTLRNHRTMQEAGLNPLPTYHQFEDIKYLHTYLKENDYVALGGMVGSPQKVLQPFLETAFSVIKEYWPKKIHGFGISALWALRRYPFYSVDSTSWLSGGRYGDIFSEGNITGRTMKKALHFEKYSRMYDYKEMIVKNVKPFLELEKNITYLWKRKGITWD